MRFAAIATLAFLLLVATSESSAAVLKGRVRADDSVERPPMMSVAVDSFACGEGGEIADPRLVIDDERGLANVVVTVIEPPDSSRPAAARLPVTLQQRGCVFEPHVVMLAPGDELLVSNDDKVFHNFRTLAKVNATVNRAQPHGKSARARFTDPEIVGVTCDVHHWMSAVLVVAPHGFVAVTGTDGSFEIEGLAPGNYALELWHETLGMRQVEARVGSEAKPVEFVLSPTSGGQP